MAPPTVQTVSGSSAFFPRSSKGPVRFGAGGCGRSSHWKQSLLQKGRFGVVSGLVSVTGARAANAATRSLVCRATLTVKEDRTGEEFPLVQQFWESLEVFRCLGAAARLKKILMVKVKVYAVTLYVEAEAAAKELKVRAYGDFMKEGTEGDYCDALIDGAFHKVLQLRMVRNVSSDQFVEAINENLRPKLQFMGQLKPLDELVSYLSTQKLEKGTNILLFWHVKGFLDIAVVAGGEPDFGKVTPGKRVESAPLCRSLYEMYLGESSIIPDARGNWARGAKNLLESTLVK